jgi:thioredoxin 1
MAHMTDRSEQKKEAVEPGCCLGSCCTGPGRWIRVVLVVAVCGAVIAVNVWRREKGAEAPAPGSVATDSSGERVQPLADQGHALPRLVDLGATECIPCKLMKPILDDFKANFSDQFKTEFIDVWKNPDAGQQYGISTIPTQIFFDAEGQELFRHEGFISKEDILKKWKEFGYEPSANNR